MLSSLQPADFYPALTWDRLMMLGKIFFDTRAWVANDAKPERGDTRTGVGFRAWEHAKYGVTVAAATEHSGWLSVKDSGARFLFLVGGVPVRFYRGESDEPVPENYGDPNAIERDQLELIAEGAGVPFDGYFRFVVVADAAGFPLDVYLVGVEFDSNEIRMSWKIPRDMDTSGSTPIVVPQAPVPLPPLTVLTIDEAAREEREREERARREEERAKNKSDSKGA